MLSEGIDRIRQVVVTICGLVCIVGTLYGIGVLGTEVQESSDGRLAADATLVAPAGPAFSIWSVIYIGLAAFVIWQWTPASGGGRTQAVGWLAGASMLLNACWLLVTQLGWLPVSVAVILALLGVLVAINRRLVARPPAGTIEQVVVDGTFGLYLGWVAVATFANTAAAVTKDAPANPSAREQAAAVAMVLIVSLVGAALARLLSGSVTVAAAMVWGLGWIAIGRTTDEPRSLATAIAAVIAAAVIAVATVWWRVDSPLRSAVARRARAHP